MALLAAVDCSLISLRSVAASRSPADDGANGTAEVEPPGFSFREQLSSRPVPGHTVLASTQSPSD